MTAIRHYLYEVEKQYPELSEAIVCVKDTFYVNDLTASVYETKTAIRLRELMGMRIK